VASSANSATFVRGVEQKWRSSARPRLVLAGPMGGPAFVGRVARRSSSAKSPWSAFTGRGTPWPFTGDRAILAAAASPRWLARRSGRRVRPTSGYEDAHSPGGARGASSNVLVSALPPWRRAFPRSWNARPSCKSHRGGPGRARTELRHFYSTPLNQRGRVREKGADAPSSKSVDGLTYRTTTATANHGNFPPGGGGKCRSSRRRRGSRMAAQESDEMWLSQNSGRSAELVME
jgi:hypothetical protein